MYKVLVFLLVFSPLAFGTVEPWSYAIMEILSFSAFGYYLIRCVRKYETLSTVPGIIPLVLFLNYLLIQLIPLPPSVLKIISPAAFSIRQNVSAATILDTWHPITVNLANTLSEFFRWSTYVAFYVLTVQLLKDRDRLKKTIVIIAVFGGLLSFSSILQFYLTKDLALWFRRVPNAMIVGPYISHNHYAGLMEMIFPVVLALFFFHRPRFRNSSLIKGIIEILSQEKANIHILIGTAALLTVTSIFVSLSRGGMLSLCLSLILFTYLIFKRITSRSNVLLIVTLVSLAAVSIGWFGWDKIFKRFEQLQNAQGVIYELRLDFWQDSLKIVKDFPITGSGAGTFIDIYPAYKTVKGDITVNHAHNDYLELAIETGVIGIILAGAFIVILIFKTYRVFLVRRDAYCVYIYIGAVTGLTSLLIHSVTDFNLHIGANGLWFFFLAGLAVSAANTGIREDSPQTRLLAVKSIQLSKLSTALVMIMMVAVTIYNLSILTSRFYFSHIRHYILSAKSTEDELRKIAKISGCAARFDPFDGEYPFAKANAEFYLKDKTAALRDFTRAVFLNPTNSNYIKRLGLFYAGIGEDQLAGKFLTAGFTSDISNADIALELGAWMLSQGQTASGVSFIKKAIELNTKLIDNALTTMAIYGVGDEDIKQAVPELPGPSIAYADFLYDSGNKLEAEAQYLTAMDYIEKGKTINQWQIERIFQFFKKRGNTKEALNVMKRAATILPLDAGIRIHLGDIYRDMGITYRAEEEYEQALFYDPNNRAANRRLENLKKTNP